MLAVQSGGIWYTGRHPKEVGGEERAKHRQGHCFVMTDKSMLFAYFDFHCES